MKKKLALGILLITLGLVFPLSAEIYERKTQFLSMQVAQLNGYWDSWNYHGFGFGWEKFKSQNMSFCLDFLIFHRHAYIPSVDVVFHLHLKPNLVHLFAGAGGSMYYTYEGGIFPEAFIGVRLDLARKFSAFTKIKFLFSKSPLGTALFSTGVTLKLK